MCERAPLCTQLTLFTQMSASLPSERAAGQGLLSPNAAVFSQASRWEELYLSQGVRHVVILGLDLAAVTVAALEGLQHGGDGEGHQEEPDDDGDLRSFLQDFNKVPPPEMHHAEIAIDGEHDEEGDAGPAVEEQHEVHGLAEHRVGAASLVVLVVIDLDREAGHQQEVSNHNVEQEDTFVHPELEPKTIVVNTDDVEGFQLQ